MSTASFGRGLWGLHMNRKERRLRDSLERKARKVSGNPGEIIRKGKPVTSNGGHQEYSQPVPFDFQVELARVPDEIQALVFAAAFILQAYKVRSRCVNASWVCVEALRGLGFAAEVS